MGSLLKTVVKNLRGKPATRRYPFQKRAAYAGSRGELVIDINKCIFCGLCTKRCPAAALAVTREPKSWTLDQYRCILCGYCTEVCPVKCLSMKREHLNVNG